MEDRITPGLYLEMTDLSPEEYAERRVNDVLKRPHVERATWWSNQKPNRTEFPRQIPEFLTLGIYELEPGFEAPDAPAGIRGHQFRIGPRPGQGNISGRPTLGLELVLISPKTPGGAQALRDWADFIHLREIAAASVPGFTMITPYENVTGGEPRYMHFYEMDTPDAEETFRIMTPTTQERRIGPTGSEGFERWMGHPELRIDYVNTFTRVGQAWAPGRGPASAG